MGQSPAQQHASLSPSLIRTLETICHNSSMCGRYRLSRRKELRERFDAYGEYDDAPRYNIAPSQPVLAIRQEPSSRHRSFSTMRRGLIPSWAKDPTIGFRTINARSETVTTTPSFREPFKSQRCLIPADGFLQCCIFSTLGGVHSLRSTFPQFL
ncbi:MAG: SOS response-associated peptidase [Candidatus Sulfotelmatobacter sp.]